MPGEPLTSIWQTAFALSPNSPVIEKKNLHRIFTRLGATIKCVTFLEPFFDTCIKDGVSLKDCKDYVFRHMRDLGSPRKLVEEEIENSCWEICKVLYGKPLQESVLFQLWTITNRLIDEDSYPPVMSQKNALWISEKIVSTLGKPMFVENIGFPKEGVKFQDFVHLLKNHLFYRVEPKLLSRSIQSLHEWLVKEVIISGYMHLRVRSQANWSNWKKYWCVLTPGKLRYGSKPVGKNPHTKTLVNDIYITKCSKFEATRGYNSIRYKFRHTFTFSIAPVFQCEFAVESEQEKCSWLTYLREGVQLTNEGTTPLRKVLNEDNSDAESKREINSKLELSYSKSVMIQQKTANEERENSPLREEEIKPSSFLKRETEHSSPSSPKMVAKKPNEFLRKEREKIKAVFMKIDKDGNGLLDKDEFAQAAKGFGLTMEEKEINLIFQTIDKNKNDCVTCDEFSDYFFASVLDETKADTSTSAMRKAFLAADRDGTGTLNFKEFTEYVWEMRSSVRISNLIEVFDKMKEDNSDEIRFDSFKEMFLADDMGIHFEDEATELDSIRGLEKQLKQAFIDAESKDLAVFIRQRWSQFASFRRSGSTGSVVMQGGSGMVDDIVPGEYNLIDLALFTDLPPLCPKHTVIKGVKWVASSVPNVSGKLLFPAEFDGNVVTDFATSERLRYYGCSFADDKQEKISLLYRHGIQDFTYENLYLSDYVTKANGGAGVERHAFSHLDCPLDEDNGRFIMAKFEGDEFHITAFKVPVRHTIYIPGGSIHSNDYLRGTWRTMLSDETAIDHVHLIRSPVGSSSDEHFQFQFLEA